MNKLNTNLETAMDNHNSRYDSTLKIQEKIIVYGLNKEFDYFKDVENYYGEFFKEWENDGFIVENDGTRHEWYNKYFIKEIKNGSVYGKNIISQIGYDSEPEAQEALDDYLLNFIN